MNKILFKKKNYKELFFYIIKNIKYNKNNFKKNILKNIKNNKICIISEFKTQSPYNGLYYNNILNYIQKIELCGSIAISVLNECNHFKCNLKDLIIVKNNTNLSILRKDFIFNEFQIIESFFLGYDILLILSNLKINLIKKMYNLSKYLNIDIIIEIHNLNDFKKILKIKPIFIGINCRNLKNLIINKKKILKIIKKIPNNIIIISESGIDKFENLKYFIDNNIRVFLIGNILLNKNKIINNFRKLLG